MPSDESANNFAYYNVNTKSDCQIPRQYLNAFGFIDYHPDGSFPWTNDDVSLSNEYVSVTEYLGIDCEMVGIGNFKLSALGRVSIVNEFGFVIYNTYVQPMEVITEYNTEYSGIRPENMLGAPREDTVQQRVASIVKGKVLVGHSIHNDLDVLKLKHPIADIRDTANFFQYRNGNKWTPSLKTLTKNYLSTEIQTGEHNSIQDAQAALRLYLLFREEWEKDSYERRMKANLDDKLIDITCMHVQPRQPDLFAESGSVFIRPMLVGAYHSSEEYKDRQFRLLLEDVLRPLRQDVRMVKQRRMLENHFKNIHILNSSDETAFEVKTFKTLLVPIERNGLKEVDWENRDIFLNGSLVILSPDNFHSIKCAKVIDVAKNQRNDVFFLRLIVNFLLDGPTWSVTTSDRFQMIESKAFFLPYEYTLNFLQSVDLNSFPMKKYIVDAVTHSEITSNLVKKTIEFSVLMNEHDNPAKSRIDPLDFDHWPNATQLNLDDSQYEALQKAITQELTIIQGPPGTGKTHISLQIVKLLLANEWLNSSPMLIVAYTNHALDQLLEPVLEFLSDKIHGGNRKKAEQSLLRIGGGCESENILPCTMMYKRQKLNEKKRINKEIKAIEKALFKVKNLDFATKLINQGILNFRLVPQFFLAKLASNEESKEFYKLWSQSQKEMEKNALMWFDLNDDYIDIRKKSLTSTNDELFLLLCNNLAGILNLKFSHIPMDVNKLKGQSLFNQNSEQQYLTRWGYYFYLVGQLAEIVKNSQHELIVANKTSKELEYYVKENPTLKQATIIGMTTTGAVKYKTIVENKLKPKIMLVEEAAHVLEAYVVASLTRHCTQLILIGDHKQLRPLIADHDLSEAFLDVSLMERLVQNGIDQKTQNWTQLKVQHRMKPEIARLICPVIYNELDNHPDVEKYPDVMGCLKNLFFIHHENNESKEHRTRSRFNAYEANYIIGLLSYFTQCGYLQSQITVICTYMAQKTFIDDALKNKSNINEVQISTVDGFQGKQNDIIILSLVRNNKENNVGFLKTDNRVCVALSRARHGLFMIGNMSNLVYSSDTWSKINEILTDIKSIGTELPLQYPSLFRPPDAFVFPTPKILQTTKTRRGRRSKRKGSKNLAKNKNQPNLANQAPVISKKIDIVANEARVVSQLQPKTSQPTKRSRGRRSKQKSTNQPDVAGRTSDTSGKCNIAVNEVLRCGHIMKMNRNEKCLQLSVKKLPCGHEIRAHCYQSLASLICKRIKPIKLPCGHTQNTTCRASSDISISCNIVVSRTLKCDHTATAPCGSNFSKIKCNTRTAKILSCGHKTQVLCHQTRNRVKCGFVVKRKMACGHEISTACHLYSTAICISKVTKTFACGHTITVPCQQQNCIAVIRRQLSCGHEVQVFCGEENTNIKCNYIIKYKYPCGHIHRFPCSTTSKKSKKCNANVRRILPCGHRQETACHQNPQLIKCKHLVTRQRMKMECHKLSDIENLVERLGSIVLQGSIS